METWLEAALDYIPSWLAFQMRQSEQPGCLVAIACHGEIVLEQAFGHADLGTGERLTSRHRFRVASHSKSFTAAGIMKLREQGKLGLDDNVGHHVSGLHKRVAETTIGQLLSHSAGLTRDGADAGQFTGRRPFLSTKELMAELHAPPAIEPNTRFKYSNHGFALLGLVIETVAGEPYRSWIRREIVEAAGLTETEPDMPLAKGTPLARGHTNRLLHGRRLTVRGDDATHAIGPAAGFVSTASDLARFFAQLDPGASKSVISAASRREMTRRQWRNPHAGLESYYGLGTIGGNLGGWDWFGHTGGLLGYISRTCVLPQHALSISVLTNAVDGWAALWLDGIMHILRTFQTRGAPARKVSDWTGRWWSAWGAVDLVPLGSTVLIANPLFGNPFADASEIAVARPDTGRIALANGYSSHGEPVRRVRDAGGVVTELWLGGSLLRSETEVADEMEQRYGGKPRRAGPKGKKRR